jgi:DNA primase
MYEAEKLKILKDIFGYCHKSGEEFLFLCKKCGHDKRKLSINIEKNVFKCWICDYRGNNVTRLVKRYGSFLQKQEWEGLVSSLDLDVSIEEMLFGKEEEIEEETILSLPKEFISLANKSAPLSAVSARKYLSSRGVSKKDILKWKIGYCSKGEYKDRIIIPSFNEEGRVNYFIARAYGKAWPPYKNPNASKDIVFNHLYVDFKNDLTLVEGVFDAINAENAVPILGSSLREDSRLFQEIVKWDTTVYVALDPDAEKKAMKMIKNLLLYGVEVYKIDVSGYKDVGEMTKKEFLKRKMEAVEMTNEEYLSAAFLAF